MFQNVDKEIILNRREWLENLLDSANTLHIDTLNLTQVPGEWKLSGRIQPYHYLTLVVNSVNHAESGSFVKDVGTGGFLWLNPGEPHSMQPQVKVRPHRFYHLKFSLTRNNVPLLLDKPWLFLPDAGDLRELFQGLRDAFLQKPGPYSAYLVRIKLAALVCEVFRKSEEPEKSRPTLNIHQRRTISLLQETAVSGTLTPAMIAKKVRLNPDYFSRIFKNTYGYSPRTWLTMERMRKAAALLTESNLSISEISRTVNYEDIYVFSKLFKKHYGCSPRHYRNSF